MKNSSLHRLIIVSAIPEKRRFCHMKAGVDEQVLAFSSRFSLFSVRALTDVLGDPDDQSIQQASETSFLDLRFSLVV